MSCLRHLMGTGGVGKKIAQQIEYVFKVVVNADVLYHKFDHALSIILIKPDRAADAYVEALVFRKRRCDHAITQFGFNQTAGLAVLLYSCCVAREKDGMSPR